MTWIEKLSVALEKTIRTAVSDNDDDQELRWPYDTFLVKDLVGTNTISLENPRQILIRGMAKVETLISRAFGPRGANVSVTLSPRQVISHKQGSVIVDAVHSANSIEENGIEQMRKVSRHISDAVGDGTKTAMLLAHALVEEGQSAIGQAFSLKDILHGIEKAVTAALSSIVGQSQACSVDCLLAVAQTASSLTGAGAAGFPSQELACSQTATTALASSHSHFPVLWRRYFPASVPAAGIGHSQRFHPFLRSSNSLEK